MGEEACVDKASEKAPRFRGRLKLHRPPCRAHPAAAEIGSALTMSRNLPKTNTRKQAEQQQSFASFLSELFSLLTRSLGSHPPSLDLMGLPALPASFAREKRSRFVRRRALEALAKVS